MGLGYPLLLFIYRKSMRPADRIKSREPMGDKKSMLTQGAVQGTRKSGILDNVYMNIDRPIIPQFQHTEKIKNMTLASISILPTKNDLTEAVKEASEAYKGRARLTHNLKEVEDWINQILVRIMKNPERSLVYLLKNPDLYEQSLFDELTDAVRDKKAWEKDFSTFPWEYSPHSRRKRKRK